MAIPADRYKLLPLRGVKANLDAGVEDILDGEICYATDEDQYYQKEGSVLVSVGPTKAQGALADSSIQPGDGVSSLTNDAGYITLAEVPGDLVTSVNGNVGDVVLGKGDVGLNDVDNTSDADKPISTATQAALDDKADLVDGVIPNSQLPSIAISEYLGLAADETAMLALNGEKGDWCVRDDLSNTWIVTGDDSSQIGGWTELATPADLVSSVNGYQGAVVLSAADVGAAPSTLDLQGVTSNGNTTTTGATFSGDIQSGGLPYNGVIGSQMQSAGVVNACRAGTAGLWYGYQEGSTTETSSIAADGSASFASGSFEIDGSGTIQTNINSAGHVKLDSTGVFSDPNIWLNSVTGSGTFSNTVQSPSFFGNATGTAQIWYGGATGTSIITADGNGTFDGAVVSVGDPTNGATNGTRLGSTVQCGNAGGSVWAGYTVGNSTATSTISNTGSASFTSGVKMFRTAGDSSTRINIGESDTLAVWQNDGNFSIGYDGTGTFGGDLRVQDGGNFRVRIANDATQDAILLQNDGSASFAGGDVNIDSSGRLGIGTSAPSAQIEIEGNVSSVTQFSGFQGLRIQNANGAAFGVTADINFVAGTGSNNRGAVIGAEYVSGTNGNDLYFATNENSVSTNDTPTERMRIDSSGDVGIGTGAAINLSASGRRTLALNGNSENAISFSHSGTLAAFLYTSSTEFRMQSEISVPLVFRPNNSEAMRIDSTGMVGIGTSTPTRITGGNTNLTLGPGSSGYGGSEIHMESAEHNGSNNGANISYIENTLYLTNREAGPVAFYTSALERMRIDSSGRVLVGTSSDLSGNDADVKLQVSSSGGATIQLARDDSSTVGNNLLGAIVGSTADGGASQRVCQINFRADGDQTSDDHPGRIEFLTTADGASSPTERLRIDSSGRVGIGTTTPTRTLTVQGDMNLASGSNIESDSSDGTLRIQGGSTYPGGTILMGGGSGTNDIRFSTTGVSTSVSATERMRIDSSGHVGIGKTDLNETFEIFDDTHPYIYLQNSTTGTSASDGFSIVEFGLDTYINNREAGNMLFFNNGSERMRIDSSGNLGIGTLDPQAKLDVNGSATFKSQVTTGALRAFDANETARIKSSRTSGDLLTLWGGATSISDGTKVISFEADGNANFGDSSKEAKLAVQGVYNQTGLIVSAGGADYSNCAEFYNASNVLAASIGGGGSATFVGDVQAGGNPLNGEAQGAELGSYGGFNAARTTGTNSVFNGFLVTEEPSAPTSSILANGSATFASGSFVIDGSGTIQTNLNSVGHIKLDSTGDFSDPNIWLNAIDGSAIFKGLLTTHNGARLWRPANSTTCDLQTPGTSDNTYFLRGEGGVSSNGGSGAVKFFITAAGNATFTGTVTANGTVLTSDARFKENIAPANSQLDDVVALGGLLKNYDWNEDAPANDEIRAVRQLGLIAQEAEEVCPEIIKEIGSGEDSYKGISQDALVMKLLGAVAELTAEVVELRAQIKS